MALIIYSFGSTNTVFDEKGTGITVKALSGAKPKNIGKYTGKDKVIQRSVLAVKNSKKYFDDLFDKVTTEKPDYIAFWCNRGHHRSVACAELFKRNYFPTAKVIHLSLSK